jgi:tetratricopeptide (TPR) repeat protein
LTPEIRQALQQGIVAHRKGNFREAERLYRVVLKSHPKNADACHNLGLLAIAANKPAVALPLFKTALDADRTVEQYWVSYITALIKEKKFDRAMKLIRQASKQAATKQRLHEVYNSLGIGLKAVGNLREAENSLRKAISIAPKNHVSHINLGNTLLELGLSEDAVACFKHAISLKPDVAEAHFNLANTLFRLGKFHDAEASYKQAITLNPGHAWAHNNLGLTLSKLERLEQAEKHYKAAIKLNPDFFEAYLNLGNAHYGLQELAQAEADYRKAIEIKPDYAEPYFNLCELLEKTNRLEEVLSVVKQGRASVFEHEDEFLFFEAFTLFRQEKHEAVGAIVTKINLNKLSTNRKTIFLKLKADWLHDHKDFDGAFNAYLAMNNIVKSSVEYKLSQPDQYFSMQREKVREIEKLQRGSNHNSSVIADWFQPTFLIGFPRSGTTLLDTILRSHSKIDVIEEQPLVIKMQEKLGVSKTSSEIELIDDNLAKTLSEVYFAELEKRIQIRHDAVLIDKLPLNILSIPLITQVFPRAKFILALRHPLDCVLSCWMQNFKINPAMANMVELDRTVDFYCIVMELLELCKQRYQLDIHSIRYEDLVVDFTGNISELLTFLDLSWEEQLKGYQETAIARGKINTPSYSQVIKPIYDSAAYRWKKYEQNLLPYKKRLAIWVEAYGYNL